jgi:predicted O-methyltransferase YrrM
MTRLGELNYSDRVEHGYTYLYDEIFAPYRYKDTRVLEIGYARGRGTRMLAEFFPRGTVHSFDIEPNMQHYGNLTKELKKRIKLYKGDQSDPESIQAVLQQVYDGPKNAAKRGYRQFDLIIDDGSHRPEHQQISFEKLWPEVVAGGLYIIEDFHPFYKEGQHKTVSWLFDMVHKLNKWGHKTDSPELTDTDWIMFSYNQAILRKAPSE